MQLKWRKLLVTIILWLAAELFLNLVGLDNIADYSEFIFEHHLVVVNQYNQ